MRLLSLLLLLPALSFAEGDEWLKKDNPNELAVIARTYNCPVSTTELQDLAKGVLIRSRIKPLGGWTPSVVALYAYIDCIKPADVYVFRYDLYFARFSDSPFSDDPVITHTPLWDYSNVGIGQASFITESIKLAIEEAITDYLKANFDLDEDDSDE